MVSLTFLIYLATEAKELSARLNRNALEIFIDEYCYYNPGSSIKYSDFWTKFQEWLDPQDLTSWSKIRVGRSLPSIYPKGRLTSDGGQFHIGNISFTKPEVIKSKKYILQQGNLVLEN